MQKALARKAELRAEKLAPEISPLKVVEPLPELPPEPTPALPLEPSHELLQASESATTEPKSRGRAALSAETMGLIERMASSEPFTDEGSLTNDGPFADGGPLANTPYEPVQDAQNTKNDTPDSTPTEEATPQRRPSSSAGAVDAFQLLLSSNPEAGDNTRSDLRDAPALRNPRKIVTDQPQPAHVDSAQATAENASEKVNEEDKERSLRNWFSPKSDPNPPPPPESDPTRD